jgi:hypothetical protein
MPAATVSPSTNRAIGTDWKFPIPSVGRSPVTGFAFLYFIAESTRLVSVKIVDSCTKPKPDGQSGQCTEMERRNLFTFPPTEKAMHSLSAWL